MSKNIHFIAIGGSAMHNLALALHDLGNAITGSDDEIYEPSRSRLEKSGLLPKEMGWHDHHIHSDLDCIILGMHAKPDNPELKRAQELNIPIYSYPEYIAKVSQKQRKIVIAGSHGKTSTTSMIMHVLGKQDLDYDYLVGAQLEGFDRMVKLTNAPLIILEGDEYLSSPIDRRPKIMHYEPDIAVITGVAWDHINVFPTFENYKDQFRVFINKIRKGAKLFYYQNDKALVDIINEGKHVCGTVGYDKVDNVKDKVNIESQSYSLSVIGDHNMQNVEAARSVCNELGIPDHDFFTALQDFKGAAKRLQLRGHRTGYKVYQDFAHAPSKVTATCNAVKEWFGSDKLYAFFELHTFSSLNKEFLPNYKGALDKADVAYIVYDEHTLKMKDMPHLDRDFVAQQFDHPNLQVISKNELVLQTVQALPKDGNLLMMSSGTFGKLDWAAIVD